MLNCKRHNSSISKQYYNYCTVSSDALVLYVTEVTGHLKLEMWVTGRYPLFLYIFVRHLKDNITYNF